VGKPAKVLSRELKRSFVFLIDEDKETGSLLVYNDWVVIQNSVEIAESQHPLIRILLGVGDKVFQKLFALLTILIQIVQKNDFNPLSPPEKLPNIFSNEFTALFIDFLWEGF
jgi:hypothetical protein